MTKISHKHHVHNYMEAMGHIGEHEAILAIELAHRLGLTQRQLRQALLEINEDFTIKNMASFANNGVYLTASTKEVKKARQRAIRAIKRNVVRVRKCDYILNDITQLDLFSILEEALQEQFDQQALQEAINEQNK